MHIHPMWREYPSLQKELEAVVALIEKNITIRNEEIQEKVTDLLFSGGKLLRPAYSLLFSGFSENRDVSKAQAVAAAVEVLHMATLIHDDVVDDSALRRGQATLNATYNNRMAIYTGDYLFMVSFRLLQKYVQDAAVLDLDSGGIEKILVGELSQMARKYNVHMRMRDYLSQIQGKTAQLFALSCYSGAFQAQASESFARQAAQIGNHIGMAFQIIDDTLDYAADASLLNKPAGQDLKNGIYTAPLLYALQQERSKLAPFLLKKAEITEEELSQVEKIIQETNGVQKAQGLAEKYTQKALRQIERLPDYPEKKLLQKITQQVMKRQG